MAIESFGEIEKYFLDHAADEDVGKFVGQFRQTLDRDNVVNYLESENGRALKQSIADQAAQRAIDNFREKHLAKEVELEMLKRNPPKSDVEKRLEDIERQNALLVSERTRERLKNETIKTLAEKDEVLGKYAPALADFVVGATEEETTARREAIAAIIQKAAQDMAGNALKATAQKPTPGAGTGTGGTDLETQYKDALDRWKQTKNPSDLVTVNRLDRELRQQKKE